MRVLLINQVYYPDVAATAQHADDLARHLVRAGHEVHVIASRSIYGTKGATLAKYEEVDGVRIHRVGRSLFGKAGILARAADFAVFYVLAMFKALTMKRCDVSVCFTTPPFISLVGWVLRVLRRTKFVYWVMDMYPDVPVVCGVMKERALSTRFFNWIDRFCLKRADRVVVLGRCMRDRVLAKGADPGKVVHIGVWSDQSEVKPIAREDNEYTERWGLDGKFVVMYSGNFGLAHDVKTMLHAVERLKDDDRFRFLFVGGGKKKAEVEAFVREHGLTNAVVDDYQPREKLDQSLSCADVHLATMIPGAEGLIVPCKLFGIMAAGRPTVFIGSRKSELALVLEEHDCGVVVEPGDTDELVDRLRSLADEPETVRRMGEHARRALSDAYSRERACEAWRVQLEGVVRGDSATVPARNEPGAAPMGVRVSEQVVPKRRSNIEVLIPTFNESANLPHALASVVEWADCVHVVDSESTDDTREIAERYGARVTVQPWLGYAKQKNWAIESLPWEADWLFILDADEVIQPDLREELLRIASRPADEVAEAGFYINRYFIFMGRRIRHCGYYPSWNLRFFKRGKAEYEEREVHEHMILDGPSAKLKGHMEHYDRRGLEHFIAKHNRYSTLEAREILRGPRPNGVSPDQLDSSLRLRRWLKYRVLPRLPFVGLWRFLYMYTLRLGFLDGVAGARFCQLLATYDTFISLKLAELRAQQAEEALPEPPVRNSGLAIPEGDPVDTPVDACETVEVDR